MRHVKITVDQASTMAWLQTFIKGSTQNEVENQEDFLSIDSEDKFEMSVHTTDKIVLALMRKKLNMVIEVLPSA
jgi:hypothetical protein